MRAFGAGLMRDQRHAQHLGSQLTGLLNRLGDFDASTFAATSGVNLCLDDDPAGSRIEQILGRGFRRIAAFRHLAARNRNTILLQDCLALILMNFHNDSDSTFVLLVPTSLSLAQLPGRTLLAASTSGSKPLIL